MGSSQSAPATAPTAPTTTTSHEKKEPFFYSKDDTTTMDAVTAKTTSATTAAAVNAKEAKRLSGMALVQYKCRKRKKVYDKCVTQWYSQEFLPGKSVDQEGACGELFDHYRQCILKGIRKEIWDKQGLPPPKDGSPLAEVEDDE